ncbi:hypothetical protein [Oryzicola mucosus]|uniref:Uncharacterized protein n=1 Tax=Oryzicola mucosus TaxID=2767425 RepID=A0A8J6PYZ4_9HYPH|nr:hypothetical protein [Oryzicola mucosus]MBD0417233.1 hypothetical protein [Oryzicola mucosus]
MDPELEQIGSWHELFNLLCDRAGFVDTAQLAAQYCEVTKGSGQSHLETAMRNLSNWRTGKHLPRPRSVRILSQLLKVDDNPEVLSMWNALYQRARGADTEEGPAYTSSVAPDATPRAHVSSATGFGIMSMVMAGIVLFAVGVGTGAIASTGWRPWRTATDDAPLITYLPEVRLVVGQSRIIHGERGDCGQLPREWRDVWGNLPTSRIGEFTDGGLVRRYSMFCKGVTPARGIRFAALSPGTEEMYVTGDYMKITVVAEDELTPVHSENKQETPQND